MGVFGTFAFGRDVRSDFGWRNGAAETFREGETRANCTIG
jgi:hypothetical protein